MTIFNGNTLEEVIFIATGDSSYKAEAILELKERIEEKLFIIERYKEAIKNKSSSEAEERIRNYQQIVKDITNVIESNS